MENSNLISVTPEFKALAKVFGEKIREMGILNGINRGDFDNEDEYEANLLGEAYEFLDEVFFMDMANIAKDVALGRDI